MSKEGASREVLGSMIGRVKDLQKRLRSIELANWVQLASGFLSIGHRPSAKLVTDLKLQNTSHILTLLSESEGGKTIEALSKKAQIGWLRFPMESAQPIQEDRHPQIAK